MIGKIFINGQIGTTLNKDGEIEQKGVDLLDVIKQVQGQPHSTSFEVNINSQGGVVDVGFDIYDYLKSLKLPITTIGSGLVASIATVIFMAGDNRKIKNGTRFMIHLPSGMAQGTADDISNYSQLLKDVENKLVKFYTTNLGLTEEAIKPLLKQETWLSLDDAFDMKFVTEMEMEFPAVAIYTNNLKTDNKMTKEDKTWIEEQFTNFMANFKSKPKAITLADSNGVNVEFPTVMDGENPQVGDTATVDGQPADGTFIMPQMENVSIVCVEGVVTEIVPVDAGTDSEEMATLKAENEALKEQLATATNDVTANATKLETIETEFTNFKAQITAKFETTPSEKKDEKKETKTRTLLKQ